MGRLIDEDDAIRIVEFECGKWTGLARTISRAIQRLPSAQPTEASCWGCNCQKMERLKEQKTFSEMVHLHDAKRTTEQTTEQI